MNQSSIHVCVRKRPPINSDIIKIINNKLKVYDEKKRLILVNGIKYILINMMMFF